MQNQANIVGSPFLSKMRCFNRAENKWVESFVLSSEGRVYQSSSIGEPENFDKHVQSNIYLDDLDLTDITNDAVILRYIGINDKNNNEIFEGDIVEYFINPHLTPMEAQELIDKNEVLQKIRVRKLIKNVFANDDDIKNSVILGNVFESPDL